MNNNNNSKIIRKTNYSSTTFIVIIGVLSLAFVIVYLYNTYKAAKLLATSVTIPYSICPSYWDSIGNGKLYSIPFNLCASYSLQESR